MNLSSHQGMTISIKTILLKEQNEELIDKESMGFGGEKFAQTVYEQFQVLLKLCQITGAPFSSNDLRPFGGKCSRLLKLYCTLMNFFRIGNLLFIANFVHFYLKLNSLLITFYAYNLCAMASLAVLSLRRQAVITSMKTILKTISRVTLKSTGKKWNLRLFMLLNAFSVLIIAASIGLTVQNNRSLKEVPSAINFFGYSFENEMKEKLLVAVRFSMAFTFISSSMMCSTTLLLSSTVYYYLSEAVYGFGLKLKKRFESKTFNQESISGNICMFEKIMTMVGEVDHAFSTGVLFLYGASVSCFFNALSIALSSKRIFITLYVFVAVMFAAALGSFFLLTHAGNRVNSKFQHLRNLLINCSGLVTQNYLSIRDLTTFTIMAQDIRTADLHLTGGDMFIIRKDMILSVAGVMITYGVLIFQLDQHEKVG
ncbi:uncharacterized protein TNCT_659101 [Trichonephila clavata]|uniref:Gustatory receptor n=1 Tax=Trichonephila clavata TaxID=2740835 RepID=A0A8X6G2M1_TRICU|nr:uncharacterized protein TNCT_659101 [Trichonephila clavata]